MAGEDRIADLVREAMDQFDSGMSLAALARRCHRIAALRGDRANMFWLSLELSDLTVKPEGIVDKTLAQREFEKVPVEDRGAFFAKGEAYSARRALPDGNIYGASLEQAERMLALAMEEAALIARVPEGMHPQDLGLRLLRMSEPLAKINEMRRQFEHMLSVIRTALWEFLVETEWALTFGEASAETFDRLRVYVDRQLSTISPPALEQFQAAYRRLKDGGEEDRAHALTSCRRVLKTLADELYPARSEPVMGVDGKLHDVGDAAFVNRLVEYVAETVGSHKNGAVVRAAVHDAAIRLDALNDLASKGVHAAVTAYEVDTCVVQTYLVVADVLRIRERAQVASPIDQPKAEGEAAAIIDDEPPASRGQE